jgi:hypothetical protein
MGGGREVGGGQNWRMRQFFLAALAPSAVQRFRDDGRTNTDMFGSIKGLSEVGAWKCKPNRHLTLAAEKYLRNDPIK